MIEWMQRLLLLVVVLGLVLGGKPYVASLSADTASPVEAAPDLASGRELIGEQLDFRVRWGAITAGTATFRAEKVGRERVRFGLSVRTTPFVDVFYRVRDEFTSTVIGDTLRSLRYEKIGQEGKRSRNEAVRYFLDPPVAVYARDGVESPPSVTPDLVHDPLAALYAFRLLGPASGRFELDVSDGRKSVRGEVVILGREEVKTPAGTFQAIKVEPKLEGVGGVFRRSPGARVFLWLTDDRWRRPVKLESKVSVGSFTAELVSGRHGSWSISSPDSPDPDPDPEIDPETDASGLPSTQPGTQGARRQGEANAAPDTVRRTARQTASRSQ